MKCRADQMSVAYKSSWLCSRTKKVRNKMCLVEKNQHMKIKQQQKQKQNNTITRNRKKITKTLQEAKQTSK